MPTRIVNEDLSMIRKEWLSEKSLTMRRFAENTGIDYNTVTRWFSYGSTPMRLHLANIIKVYPDWPR